MNSVGVKADYMIYDDDPNQIDDDWNQKWYANVYKNFDSHINKSIPLYFETHDLYLKFSDFFYKKKVK